MNQFWSGYYKKYIAGALTAVSVFLFMKYILTLVMPFFLAICLIFAMQPVLRTLERRLHIGKGILAGALFLLALCIVGLILWYGFSALCGQIRLLARNIDGYEECLCRFVHSCCDGLERNLGINADSMEKLIFTRVDQLAEDMKLRALPGVMNHSVSYAKMIASAAALIFMTFIATILLAKDYRRIREDLRGFRWFTAAEQIGGDIGRMAGHYLKAQGIILCTITVLCVLVLWAMGISHSVTAGIFAGLLDALPFIGTGCVLVPVALWQLIQGKLLRCVGVLLLYAACALVREFLEPKLLGERMGFYPAVILLAIYSGIKLYGISGVLLGPLSFLLVKEIYGKMSYFFEND